MDFRKMYKRTDFDQPNLLVNQRTLRRKRLNDHRFNRRSDLFNANRIGSQDNLQEPLKKPNKAKKVNQDSANSFLTRFLNWREERNRNKHLEKQSNLKAKPVFKVGKVHHQWYSPPVTKYDKMKNKLECENIRNIDNINISNNKNNEKVRLALIDSQFTTPNDKSFMSIFNRKVTARRLQNEHTKNYLQHLFNDTLNFLPEEFDTSTPAQTEVAFADGKGISLKAQEEEALEYTKDEKLITRDIHHLIKDCHAHFQKFEEVEKENNWMDKEARNSQSCSQVLSLKITTRNSS